MLERLPEAQTEEIFCFCLLISHPSVSPQFPQIHLEALDTGDWDTPVGQASAALGAEQGRWRKEWV